MINGPMVFPNIDPIAFSIGPLHVHWYGLMYLLGFLLAYGLAHVRSKKLALGWTDIDIGDLIFYAAVGLFWADGLVMLFFITPQRLFMPHGL